MFLRNFPVASVTTLKVDATRAFGSDTVRSADTYVVHWYNDGLKALPRPPDRDSIQALADRQMFSRLARPFLPGDTHREALP